MTSESRIAGTKIKVLNLYAGIGGNRKLWENVEVTAVENSPEIAAIYQRFYPKDQVIIDDAKQYLLDHYQEFDFIWASPPCPSHSKINRFTKHKISKLPDMDLYSIIIFLQHFCKSKWVVENVEPYYTPLIEPTIKGGRHFFWSNFPMILNSPKHPGNIKHITRFDLMEWLGITLEEKTHVGKNHDHRQILRNCVHPELGKQILSAAFNQQRLDEVFNFA